MKHTNLLSFEQQLSGAEMPAVVLIASKEPFDRSAALQAVKKRMGDEVIPQIFDAEAVLPGLLAQELETLSLLATGRLLIVTRAEKAKKPIADVIDRYLAKPNASLCLVIEGETLPASWVQAAQAVGAVVQFPEVKPWEKERHCVLWIKEAFRQEGIAIDDEAAALMVTRIGFDKQLLQQEVQKLSCFAAEEKKISVQDVKSLVAHQTVDSIWKLGEAIFQRQATNALRIARALLRDGITIQVLIRHIRKQVETEFTVCSILARGGTPTDVSEAFPYMSGRILQHHLLLAKGYGLSRFRRAMLTLAQIDTDSKSGNSDAEQLLDTLVLRLTR